MASLTSYMYLIVCSRLYPTPGAEHLKVLEFLNSYFIPFHVMQRSKHYYFGLVARGSANNKGADQPANQRLCYSLIGINNISTCYTRNFSFLAGLCS